jgi:hypothetical protein
MKKPSLNINTFLRAARRTRCADLFNARLLEDQPLEKNGIQDGRDAKNFCTELRPFNFPSFIVLNSPEQKADAVT